MRRLLDKDEELKVAAQGKQVQRAQDAASFERRNDIYTQNANMFISNNANPFLISPYGPPANLISKQLLAQLSSIVSTLANSLSTVIDINTYTLSITNIRPITGDLTQTINISASTLNIQGAPPTSALNVGTIANFTNTLNFVNMFGQNVTGSTIFAANAVTTNVAVVSTLFARNAISTNTAVVSTLFAATSISTNTTVMSTLFAATSISTNATVVSTLFAATDVTTNSTILSTVRFPPYTIVGTVGIGFTPVGVSQGVLNIDVGGAPFRIPYYT